MGCKVIAHRGANKKATLPRALISGVGISFAILLIFSRIFSGIIMTASNPTGSIKTVSLVTLLVSGAVSGFVISKAKGDGGTFTSLLSSLVFIGIILAVSLILTKGRVGGTIFMNCLCYFLISLFSSFLAKKRYRRRRR